VKHLAGVQAIHKRLIRRLALMGIAIALLLGMGVWLFQHDRIGSEIVERAGHSVELLNEELRPYLDAAGRPDRAALQREVSRFAVHVLRSSAGHFAAVNIYSPGFDLWAQVEDPVYGNLEAIRHALDQIQKPPAAAELPHTRSFHIAGRLHLQTMAALSDQEGRTAAYIVAIYALSAQGMDDIRRNTIRAVMAVIGIVIATTALLYPVIVALLRSLAGASLNLLDSHLETLKLLGSAIAKRDHDTDLHNHRVTIAAVHLAEACGLTAADLQNLIKGAFLHDVGKLAIPDNILLKAGPLNAEEFTVMQGHVRHGMDIVRRSKWLADAAPVVGYHHERFNGGGYCDGLQGAAIPLTARIFAVADVFDALTSQRPYKKAFPLEQTMRLMEESRGTHFDPDVLKRFMPMAPKLHAELVGSTPAQLEEHLQRIINTYFTPEKMIDEF